MENSSSSSFSIKLLGQKPSCVCVCAVFWWLFKSNDETLIKCCMYIFIGLPGNRNGRFNRIFSVSLQFTFFSVYASISVIYFHWVLSNHNSSIADYTVYDQLKIRTQMWISFESEASVWHLLWVTFRTEVVEFWCARLLNDIQLGSIILQRIKLGTWNRLNI